MNRLSAHIGYLYTELPLADRMAAAARDGFTAVEHPEPWDIPATEMAARISDLGLTFSQVTSGMGAAGEKGLAAVPGRQADFRAGFQRGLDYALMLDCPFVHPMAGTGGDDATYRGNIEWALRACETTPARVLVEAITIPGYHMGTLAAAAALQDAFGMVAPHPLPPHEGEGSAKQPIVGNRVSPPPRGEGKGGGQSSKGIALLFDSFHARTNGLDPAMWLQTNTHRIGHVHIADHPGRHEPSSGTLDFAAIMHALSAANYQGAIGFEYIPSTSTTATTGFLRDWLAQLNTKTNPIGSRA